VGEPRAAVGCGLGVAGSVMTGWGWTLVRQRGQAGVGLFAVAGDQPGGGGLQLAVQSGSVLRQGRFRPCQVGVVRRSGGLVSWRRTFP